MDRRPPSAGPTRAVALYGTDEVAVPPRVLRAGDLSVELEAGNLRYVRWAGEEVLRAVSFIVRDADWGTYAPTISNLVVDEDEGAFRVTYRAEVGGDAGFAYEARIEGGSDGTLTFHGSGRSRTSFETNRTGFVILHPIDGIAGRPVTIRQTDGTEVAGTFPEAIDPVQPMMDLRALIHATPGGLRVETVMEGDTYEMEDQRNWTDASYKTYVRPLARPWPYRIEPDEEVAQSVTVRISGAAAATRRQGAVALTVGEVLDAVPPLGVGLRPEDAATAMRVVDKLRALAPAYLVCHHDPRAGHDASSLEAMLAVARAVGADPWLELVVAASDDDGASVEAAAFGDWSRGAGHPFGTVLISPAPDLKCTLPGSIWPEAPDAARLFDAMRRAFPKARIGGGMLSYFTELNRKRPPVDHLDFVTFTTSPMVHAGDDRSVLETREAHGAVALSASAIAGGLPWAVGPSAIGMRDNPYGAAAKDNPGNVRQAMNRNDPRQRGLLGAVWALAYFADFASGGASAIALGGITGAFGAISVPMADPQPWFDRAGGVYPVFHVLRGIARLRGAELLSLDLPAAGPVCGLAAHLNDGTEIWIGNTSSDPATVTLPRGASVAILDAAGFADAAVSPGYMDAHSSASGQLTLDAYAIARVLTA